MYSISSEQEYIPLEKFSSEVTVVLCSCCVGIVMEAFGCLRMTRTMLERLCRPVLIFVLLFCFAIQARKIQKNKKVSFSFLFSWLGGWSNDKVQFKQYHHGLWPCWGQVTEVPRPIRLPKTRIQAWKNGKYIQSYWKSLACTRDPCRHRQGKFTSYNLWHIWDKFILGKMVTVEKQSFQLVPALGLVSEIHLSAWWVCSS